MMMNLQLYFVTVFVQSEWRGGMAIFEFVEVEHF